MEEEKFPFRVETDSVLQKKFLDSTDSKLHVKLDFEKKDIDFSWLPVFEDTCYYIDNILRNPKRFIINEEEIVKIEQSKKVTVESIIHLTQHTNLIQKYDPEKNEVKPSKILNINKEESLDTYENRFIYTLIRLMDEFLERNVKNDDEESYCIDEKKIQYDGESVLGNEKVNIHLQVMSNNNSTTKEELVGGLTIAERIKKVKIQLAGFKESELYTTLYKAHVSQVRPPIRRTNVILKNPNFIKAMEMWNFLQNYDRSSFSLVKDHQDYVDTGYLKDEFNTTFLLNYLAMNSLSRSAQNQMEESEYVRETVSKIMETILDRDEDLDKEKFYQLIDEEYQSARKRIDERDHLIQTTLQEKLQECNDRIASVIAELEAQEDDTENQEQ